jgi:ArsR family transcriptional regulator
MTGMDPKLYDEVAQLHAQICSALADSTRILLLYALSDRSRNVGDLADTLKLPQPTISRHLKVLRERGMVVAHRDGQSIYYALTDKRTIHALDLLRAVLADHLKTQSDLASTLIESEGDKPDGSA